MSAPKAYSISRALRETLERGAPATGIEAEAHYAELKRREAIAGLVNLSSARSAGAHALALPISTRVVAVGGSDGSLVGEEKSVASDLLDFSAVKDAGATVLEGLTADISVSWTSKLPVPTWQPELGFSTETDPEFSAIMLSPRRVTGSTIVSRQLLAQATGPGGQALDKFLLEELSRSCSSQLDRIALYGNPDANPNQPRGVKFTPGIWEIAIAAEPAWEFLTEAERLVEVQNVAMDSFGYIVSPDVRKLLRDSQRWVAASSAIWEHIRGFSSNEVNTPEIFFGAWNQLVIGIWAADIVNNPYTRAVSAQTELVANLFCSVGIRRPACFGLATIVVPPRMARQRDELRVTSGKAPIAPPEAPSPAQEPAPAAASESHPGSESSSGQVRSQNKKGPFR
jgi:hypothetical protein